jgi:hypothetical protein
MVAALFSLLYSCRRMFTSTIYECDLVEDRSPYPQTKTLKYDPHTHTNTYTHTHTHTYIYIHAHTDILRRKHRVSALKWLTFSWVAVVNILMLHVLCVVLKSVYITDLIHWTTPDTRKGSSASLPTKLLGTKK